MMNSQHSKIKILTEEFFVLGNNIFSAGIYFATVTQMKTPLKSEPLRFRQQWCFCYKPSIYTGLRTIRMYFQTGQKNQKSIKYRLKTKKLYNSNPRVYFDSNSKTACLLR